MMDYRFIDDDGTAYTVATMPSQAIIDILTVADCQIIDNAGLMSVTPQNVLERLRIELAIRELRL